ncbi:hypothetical protein [Methylobacterium durans]|uniref:hypothetical protein n=1 Tax=Methylobacterium durans TaxID=2202825 RepID=UPI0013A56B6D|nr:hypothetical protein [Methylobacterium durans]
MTSQRDATLPAFWSADRIGRGSDLRDTLIWAMLAFAAALGITWGTTLTQAAAQLLAL